MSDKYDVYHIEDFDIEKLQMRSRRPDGEPLVENDGVLDMFYDFQIPMEVPKVEWVGTSTVNAAVDIAAPVVAGISNENWQMKIAKALNFISQGEKKQLWYNWGKTKFGAIYFANISEDIERIIELGKIPNAPDDAVYLSSAYDFDDKKYLIRVWSRELPRINEGECYPMIKVKF